MFVCLSLISHAYAVQFLSNMDLKIQEGCFVLNNTTNEVGYIPFQYIWSKLVQRILELQHISKHMPTFFPIRIGSVIGDAPRSLDRQACQAVNGWTNWGAKLKPIYTRFFKVTF